MITEFVGLFWFFLSLKNDFRNFRDAIWLFSELWHKRLVRIIDLFPPCVLGLPHVVIRLQFPTFLHYKLLSFVTLQSLLVHVDLFVSKLEEIIVNLLDIPLVKILNLNISGVHLFWLWIQIRFQELALRFLGLAF